MGMLGTRLQSMHKVCLSKKYIQYILNSSLLLKSSSKRWRYSVFCPLLRNVQQYKFASTRKYFEPVSKNVDNEQL